MTVKSLISVALLSAICSLSCERAAMVAISNKTTTDKKIKVIYPPKFIFPGEGQGRLKTGKADSIKIYNLESGDIDEDIKFIPILSLDTVARTYSFVLKGNQQAMVENRYLMYKPTYKQTFIIDDTDTIKLVRRGKKFEKKPKLALGGIWEYCITDSLSPGCQCYSQPVKREKPDELSQMLDIIEKAISSLPKN